MIEVKTLVDEETRKEVFDYVIDRAGNGMNFVEVGTFVGGSICYIGQRLKEKSINVNLSIVDNFKFDLISAGAMGSVLYGGSYYNQYRNNIKACDIKVKDYVGDSIEESVKFKDKSIDFLFLDGCHESYYVERELMAWLPKMKSNSVLSGHDFNYFAVKDAVNKMFGDKVKQTTNGYSYTVEFGKGLTKSFLLHNYYGILMKVGLK